MRELNTIEVNEVSGGNLVAIGKAIVKVGKAVKNFVSDRVVQATAAGAAVGYGTSRNGDDG